MTTSTAYDERTDPLCLPADEAGRALATAPWQRFAVMGDSFAAGTGSPSPATPTFPGRNELPPRYPEPAISTLERMAHWPVRFAVSSFSRCWTSSPIW